MADLRRRHRLDQGGAWFADTTCIACDVARELARGLIAEDERGPPYFTREPRGAEQELQARRALLACPSASIGAPSGAKALAQAIPFEVAPGALFLGHNARSSFGANALVPRPEGNLMIDAPRCVPALADELERRGGVARILLTHRGDVADHARYAERLGSEAWVHEADADAGPDADERFAEDREAQRGRARHPAPGPHGREPGLPRRRPPPPPHGRFARMGPPRAGPRRLRGLHLTLLGHARGLAGPPRARDHVRVGPSGAWRPRRAEPDEMRAWLLAIVARMRA